MKLVNIHAAPVLPPTSDLPRERRVTNDPAREYAARPGRVRRLPDDLAACILCAKRFAKVTRGAISFEVDKVTYSFFHPDSITLRGCTGESKALVLYNRIELEQSGDISCIHVLTADQEYVETLPRKGKAGFFSADDAARELGAIRRREAHDDFRKQHLHEADSRRALDNARHNESELAKAAQIVDTLPCRGTATGAAAPRSEFSKASRIADVVRDADASVEAAKEDFRSDLRQHRARQAKRVAVPAGVRHDENDW